MKHLCHAAILFLSTVSNARASLIIELDFESPGDELLTEVPSTGFQWLDLTETLFSDVNDIEAGQGGYVNSGFFVPTVSQVFHLFRSASDFELNPNNSSNSKDEYVFTDDLGAGRVLALGPTAGNGLFRSDIRGWAQREPGVNSYDLLIAAFSLDGPGGIESGTVMHLKFGVDAKGTSGDNTDGIFLARSTGGAIPEPDPLAIWSILGGIGLVAGRRRRRLKAA